MRRKLILYRLLLLIVVHLEADSDGFIMSNSLTVYPFPSSQVTRSATEETAASQSSCTLLHHLELIIITLLLLIQPYSQTDNMEANVSWDIYKSKC